MADLLARFRLVDEMSDKLASMAESGQNMADSFEQAGEAATSAFGGMESAVTSATGVADGVASSIDSIQEAANNAASSADTLADTLGSYGDAAGEAAAQTDYWTDAVGNYDKSALEAVYTTEELVEMGLKSADALEEQERMFELCDQSASSLSKAIEAAADITGELSSAMDEAASTVDELSKSEDASAETKADLARASTDAAEAMAELTAAQQEAEAAMAAYDDVMASGTTDLNELEAAAERSCHAAENLAEANSKASSATDELSKATEKASEEAENGGKKGVDAVESIASALAAAGITAAIKEISESVYELVTAFSEGESTVVKATGASGEALDGLTESMMNAYAASKSADLSSTAGAIGEINTRMGLTGDTLTTVTGQFLDFSEITGTDVVGSVQSVTKIMNKWGVEGSEVESVLDKLAYAGQVSGISVSNLATVVTNSSATFQSLGMDLDNSISLLADLELYGTNSTTTVTGLRTAVNNFSDAGLNAEDALKDVISQIANMEDASEATALAVDTFGSRAGQELAGAIRSGAISVDSLSKSLEVADGTLSKTAEGAQTLDQKWEQASNNISAAFTTAVQPTLSKISSGLADVVNGVGNFLNEHPVLTKAITAVGVGIAAVATGIAAFTFVTKVAIPAVELFGVALNGALGPIGWVALAITGVVAAGTALAVMLNDTADETEGMTQVTKAQYYELQNLNEEYDQAVAKYGENSEEALRLKYQVDDLTSAFESSRQTVEEFVAEVDELCQSVQQLSDDFNSSIKEISSNETGTLALIQKYEDLASQAELTEVQQKELEAVTKSLSKSYPELSEQLDNATLSVDGYVDAMIRACEEQAKQQKEAEAQQAYVDALRKQQELEDEIAKAEANLNAEREAHGMHFDEEMQQWFNGSYTEDSPWAAWTTDLDDYNDALDELLAAQGANDALIAQIEQGWADVTEAEAAAAEETISWEDAATTAYENVEERITELCEAYGEAYNAALESFEGQFGLFDEASTKSEEYMNSTVENAQAALDSQLSYWDSYLANVEVLKSTSAEDLGVTQENYELLMSYAQDGSEQAAGLAASMVEAIQSGNTEAVTELANTAGEVAAKQDELAATTADWATNFTSQMDAIEKEMQDTVDGMNLDTEAAASATATIQSYAEAIRAGKGNAVSAAQEVANAVSAAFSSAKATVRVNVASSTPGHANGTTNAEDVFIAGERGPELIARPAKAYANGTTDSADYYIAGENGPELIVGEQGSTVFPTSETDRLINALSNSKPEVIAADQSNNEFPTREIERLISTAAGENGPEFIVGEQGSTVFPTSETDRLINALSNSKPEVIAADQSNNEFPTREIERLISTAAGENGPEFIVGEQGSTALQESETDRLIDALAGRKETPLQVLTQSDSGANSEGRTSAGEQVRRILLEIAGSGAIEVGGGTTDKEAILEVLYEHLKPVLMNIIQSEIYEEGELSYEF